MSSPLLFAFRFGYIVRMRWCYAHITRHINNGGITCNGFIINVRIYLYNTRVTANAYAINRWYTTSVGGRSETIIYDDDDVQ